MSTTYGRVIAITVVAACLVFSLSSWTGSPKIASVNAAKENKWAGKVHPRQPMNGAFLENEDLTHAMLAGVRLKKAKLKGANLEMAMLAGADLREADLEYANLKQAMLLGANFSKANLLNTNFEDANLLGASLEGARIDGASFKNTYVTQDQIDEACGKPRDLPPGLKMPKPC